MAFEPTKAFLYDEEGDYRDFSLPATLPYAPPLRASRVRRPNRLKPEIKISGRPITTIGSVSRQAPEAWVYVASGNSGGVKVGITSNLSQRAQQLGAKMVFSLPALPSVVREIETEALRRLGHMAGDGEWTRSALEAAVTAVQEAANDLRRRKHIDPHLTADEARKLRISLATGQKGR